MNNDILLQILYAKNYKNTLKYLRQYEKLMKNGVSYEQLLQLMEYDYEVFLKKENKKDEVDITSPNAVFEINEINNISTNIESKEDAICKFKALSLANSDLQDL